MTDSDSGDRCYGHHDDRFMMMTIYGYHGDYHDDDHDDEYYYYDPEYYDYYDGYDDYRYVCN